MTHLLGCPAMTDGTRHLTSAESECARTRLCEAFEVSRSELLLDAQQLDAWVGPRDELLASICHAHGWRAEMGVIYLAHLVCHLESAAGPLPAAWSCD